MVEALFVLLIYQYILIVTGHVLLGNNAVFITNYPTHFRKKYLRAHKSDLTPQTSHLTPHTLTPHTSLLTTRTSHLTPQTLTPRTSQLTHRTSHLTTHPSHLTAHTAQITPHTAQLASMRNVAEYFTLPKTTHFQVGAVQD